MNSVRKAVFPVAGIGSRFLPATKAMPKELLPIIDKPLIQYAVEEAISAGIDTLIFVTEKNKRSIEDHFDRNHDLEALLEVQGKKEEVEKIKNIIPDGVECIFVRQSKQLGLGHAILCSERAVGNEPFAVLLADDFLLGGNESVTGNLIAAFETSGKSQLSTMEVRGPDISKYGVLKFDKDKSIIGLVEKPQISNAPSNCASIGRYVVHPKIFGVLRDLSPGHLNEIQLADALNILAKKNELGSKPFTGMRFDCGSVEGYLSAISHMAKISREV